MDLNHFNPFKNTSKLGSFDSYPNQETVINPNKDRSLPGKKRRKARKEANKK